MFLHAQSITYIYQLVNGEGASIASYCFPTMWIPRSGWTKRVRYMIDIAMMYHCYLNLNKCQTLHDTLHWRHNDHEGVSSHQPHGCLLNRLFRRRSKKTSKLRVTGLCVGNSPGPVNSPHKWPVTRKMFPFDDVIMTIIFQVSGSSSTGYDVYTEFGLPGFWFNFTAHIGRGSTDIPTPMYRYALRWRHNGRDSVSNHQPHHCLLNRLFRRRSKKTSKLRVTGLCVGNSPGTGEFPARMASNAENVSISWRHNGISCSTWWHYDVLRVSALLVICVENPQVSRRFFCKKRR